MNHPLIKWAQRKDRVFLEIQLRDITDENVKLEANSVHFEGSSDSKKYAFDLDFFAEINTQQSKWNKTGFHMLFILIKKDQEAEFWPRLTKEKIKSQYIQIDWQKWVDEDEEADEADKGLGGMDPSQMQGFGGMPGMGGMGGMPGMGGMGGMPGMGGMGGMPGMQGLGGMQGMTPEMLQQMQAMQGMEGEEGEDEGNLDDLDKDEQVEGQKAQQPKAEESPKE